MGSASQEGRFNITPLKRRRLSESVADQIRQAIFRGLLAPGQKLPPERELAERFQTSRVALREALRALEKEGIISVKRGFRGGAFVAHFDNALLALLESLNTIVRLGQVERVHLTEVRTILEPEMVRLATLRAEPSDLEAIESVVVAQEGELLKTGTVNRKHDLEFHRAVADAAHNPLLKIVLNAANQSIRDAIQQSKLSLSPEMRARGVRYHRSILEAIRSRNEKLAQSLMSEHVSAVQCHLESPAESDESDAPC